MLRTAKGLASCTDLIASLDQSYFKIDLERAMKDLGLAVQGAGEFSPALEGGIACIAGAIRTNHRLALLEWLIREDCFVGKPCLENAAYFAIA
jgi:hypothetical protein